MADPGSLTWIDTTFSVEDVHVRLSIRLIDKGEREAVAIAVAWLIVSSTRCQDAVHRHIWKLVVEDVLAPNARFVVDHKNPESLGSDWWGEVMDRATVAFVEANGLELHVRHFSLLLDSQSDLNDLVS